MKSIKRKEIRSRLDKLQRELCNEYQCDIVVSYRIRKGDEKTEMAIYNSQSSHVIEAVEQATGITLEQLKSDDRHRAIADVRHIAIYLIRFNTTLSVVQIGKIFGRDHSTVLHSLNAYDRYMNRDDRFTDLQKKIMDKFLLAKAA